MSKKWLAILAAGLWPLAAAAQQESGLVLEDAWVRALPPSQPSTAAYLTLHNRGETAVGVVSASASIARTTEIHTTRRVDGYMRMEQLEGLAVAPGERVKLVPGGTHLMLMGLSFMPKPGDTIDLCVKLTSGQEVCTEAETHKTSRTPGARTFINTTKSSNTMNAVTDTFAKWRDTLLDTMPQGGIGKTFIVILALYLVGTGVLGMYWSMAPKPFDVQAHSEALLAERGGASVTGSVTTGALIGVMETLLEKPGGFLRNDRLPPGVWLDNMPNWEYGALIQARDLARAMREALSRSQSQSKEDKDLAQAEPAFNNSATTWMFPSSESKYREGIEFTRSYLHRLSDDTAQDAQFYARADNLRYWLGTVETRLGSLSQRLSASVGRVRINTDLAGEDTASQSTATPDEQMVRTPWLEIDDVFFEARGTAWALIQLLKAAEVDFADVLRKKNAQVSLRQIIRELEATQETVWSPIILNGSGLGVLANHSLVMASYISRANAAIIDMRELLSQG